MDSSDNIYYSDPSSDNFSKVLSKYEFTSNNADKRKTFMYQEPNQILLRNYISQPTIYENILLYHGLGVGKTCSSITIAEGFKEYINNMGRKIVVLVKNKNIQKNFMNELLSKCTMDEYLTDSQREMYFGILTQKNASFVEKKKELINKVHRNINKSYNFLTYGTFVNRVLGAKDFEKDEMGRNTTRVKRIDGKIVRKRAKNAIQNLNNTVIIIDEAHNITNNDVYIALHQVLSRSYNFRIVMLTATPMYDNPKEIFELSNLLNINNPEYQLPIRNELLKPTYDNKLLLTKVSSQWINNSVLKGGVINVTDGGLEKLKESLYGKVSYIQSNVETNPEKNIIGYPLINKRLGTTNVVYCQMSKYQYMTYIDALKMDVKSDSKYDISSAIQNLESAENVNEDTTISKTSSLYKNSSDASTMTYPNKLFGKDGFLSVFEKSSSGGYKLKSEHKSLLTENLKQFSNKLYKLLQNINNDPGSAFVYSNYVSYGGTSLIKQLLLNNGYKEYRSSRDFSKGERTFIVFDESTNIETREKYRRIFNSKENRYGEIIKVIIGSPIISEGITLKNIRAVHILEPSWNMSRVNQIIGRAVRNYSHHHLPVEDRNVKIYKYVSVFYQSKDDIYKMSSNILNFFIDKEKYILSEEKDRSNKKVERLLKEISFDCEFMKGRNYKDPKYDFTADCDYQKCEFSCDLKSESSTIDKSTYNLHIKFFDKYDIDYLIGLLRELFKKYFVWKLDDIVDHIKNLQPNISNEAIYTVLGHITDNKTAFEDMYNRDGFIINKGDYYIFNSSDIDINTSIYSKILDFSVDKTKYNLQQYVETKINKGISQPKIKKEKAVQQIEQPKLSKEDVEFNNDIIENNAVFGTFRQRGTKDEPFGPVDNKFRIVDIRKLKTTEWSDKRKNISGMWIGSYKKPQLIDLGNYLKIKTKMTLDEYDKEQLGLLIQKYLLEHNLVLK